MNTKKIMRSIAALTTLFALIAFVLIGCSKDSTDPNPEPYINVLPAGDYPSVAISSLSAAPVIGDPVLTLTALHADNFSPLVNAYFGKDWHGKAYYDKSGCSTLSDAWSVDVELWSFELPNQPFFWDWGWDCFWLTESYNMSGSQLVWDETHPPRFEIMTDGLWNEDEFKHSKWVNADIWRNTFFKQVLNHPDLFISMERDWALAKGSDITHSEGTYEITKEEKTGVVQAQIETIGETLSLGASASFYGVSSSIEKTFSSETTNSIEFSEEIIHTTKSTYAIPANETWRFLTLYGVERYFFSDSDGNDWSSTNLELAPGLGLIENKVRTHLMVAKFRDNQSMAYSIELVDI